MVVSLLGTGFYILLLIMVFTLFHIFLVFKSCTCNVLVQFWYWLCFITFCSHPEISLSHSCPFSALPVLKLGQQKGWAAQHICTFVPYQVFQPWFVSGYSSYLPCSCYSSHLPCSAYLGHSPYSLLSSKLSSTLLDVLVHRLGPLVFSHSLFPPQFTAPTATPTPM